VIFFLASRRERGAVGALVALAVVFVGIGVLRLVREGGGDVLTLPLALLAADLVVALALLSGWYPVRAVAQGLAIFGALVHLLIALRSAPVLIRGCSALLAAAHVYALVLLFQLSARELDEDDEGPADEPVAQPAEDQPSQPAAQTPAEPEPLVAAAPADVPASGEEPAEQPDPDLDPAAEQPDAEAGAGPDTEAEPAAELDTETDQAQQEQDQGQEPDPDSTEAPGATAGPVEPAVHPDSDPDDSEPEDDPESDDPEQDIEQRHSRHVGSAVGAERASASEERVR
jgi:hypothetical protein